MMKSSENVQSEMIYGLFEDNNVDGQAVVTYYNDLQTAKEKMYYKMMVTIEKMFGSVNDFLKSYRQDYCTIYDDYVYLKNKDGQKYQFRIEKVPVME